MRMRRLLLVFVTLALTCGTGTHFGNPAASAPSTAHYDSTFECKAAGNCRG